MSPAISGMNDVTKSFPSTSHQQPTSKRRRLLGGAYLDASCLSDLPSGVMTHVANYLAPPSRALFAAALTNQNTAASDERNTAIVGNEWTTLDFGDIKKDLAAN